MLLIDGFVLLSVSPSLGALAARCYCHRLVLLSALHVAKRS